MIYRLWVYICSHLGLVPATEKQDLLLHVFKLERELDEAIKEIERLTDENKSVWDLIDELQESSKITPATVDSFVEDVKESVLDEMLKNFKPAGEA
tara:strand:- start:10001 stop:10288 length:288 start_codon:yes stop_codon:yes gene_type:complete